MFASQRRAIVLSILKRALALLQGTKETAHDHCCREIGCLGPQTEQELADLLQRVTEATRVQSSATKESL